MPHSRASLLQTQTAVSSCLTFRSDLCVLGHAIPHQGYLFLANNGYNRMHIFPRVLCWFGGFMIPLFLESFFFEPKHRQFPHLPFPPLLRDFCLRIHWKWPACARGSSEYFSRFLIEWHLMSLSQRQVLLTFISDVSSREEAHVVFLSMPSKWVFVR